MYKCYLGNEDISESVDFIKKNEIVADKIAYSKIRQLISDGYITTDFIVPRTPNEISTDRIKDLINQFKFQFMVNNITTADGISKFMYNMIIKRNEKK